MSKCAVHMMKMKMSAMGGIQSHNQREHESKKNKEIDYEKSNCNFDTVNDEHINYHTAVKERIKELNLKKAVRKDAVVYCSFIVSSDRDFFERLAYLEHVKRENKKETVAIGVNEPEPFEYMPQEYRDDCMMAAARNFFEHATDFFKDRYGEENVLNGTVHMDEATPHMHLGVVPVTPDGRLSAKAIFTPLELKELQTDFAEKVGAKYGLERGKEGSEAEHLDEVSFKLDQRTKQLQNATDELEKVENDILSAEEVKDSLMGEIDRLQGQKDKMEDINKRYHRVMKEWVPKLTEMEVKKQELEKELPALEAQISDKEDELEAIQNAVESAYNHAAEQFGSNAEVEMAIAAARERAADKAKIRKLENTVARFERFLQKFPPAAEFWNKFIAEERPPIRRTETRRPSDGRAKKREFEIGD